MHRQQILQGENLTGIFWMIAAMAVFAVEDVFIKTATRQLPIGQVLMLFGAGGAILFACLAWPGAVVPAWSRHKWLPGSC